MFYRTKRIIKIIESFWYVYVLRDRIKYCRKLGVKIGKECQILAKVPECFGSEPWLVSIGDHVDITAGVTFLTHEGGLWVLRDLYEDMEELDFFAPIVVGNNVMIGQNTLILPGVVIGDNVIVGGHSVVTKDIPSNSIYAGVPARKISELNKFTEKMRTSAIKTKKMTQNEKRKVLELEHPEWF